MAILILDDEIDFREILQEEFESQGYQVFCAGDGLHGLQMLLKYPEISVVLSDIQMPVVGGLEFLNLSKEKFPKIPVFLMTGSFDFSKKTLIQMGAEDLYFKLDYSFDFARIADPQKKRTA